MDNSQIFNNLIKQVYKYYPVGFNYFENDYEGRVEMDKMVEHKIDKDGDDPNSRINIFYKAFSEDAVLPDSENRRYYQFPNYVVNVKLPDRMEGNILHRSNFELCISLLCDYYTFYLVDQFILKDFYEEELTSSFIVLSYEQSQEKTKHLIPAFTNNLHKYFPEKEYMPFGFLSTKFVYGVTPYPEKPPEIFSMQSKFSFFDLLFNPLFNFTVPQKSLQ